MIGQKDSPLGLKRNTEKMTTLAQLETLCREGRHYVRHEEPDNAIAAFIKALALDERAIPVHEGLAAAYFLKKDYEKAAEHFKKVTLLDPRQAKALINLGAVYNRMQDYNKAVAILRKALQKDKSSGDAHYNLGLAYRGLNQLSMAVSLIRRRFALRRTWRSPIRISPTFMSTWATSNRPSSITRRPWKLIRGFERGSAAWKLRRK